MEEPKKIANPQQCAKWQVQTSSSKSSVPDPVGLNTVAVDVVPSIRELACQEPRLYMKKGKLKPYSESPGEDERRKRDLQRKLLMDLSRYYPLERSNDEWTRAALLKKGECGLSPRCTDNISLTRVLLSVGGPGEATTPLGTFRRASSLSSDRFSSGFAYILRTLWNSLS